ncbi:sodium:proton exchanger [candidate division WWE3 bacterium]|jgi:Kef-type K+ transport system membrane component KefB|uniref:Sodium:proton exchanger n=1 Tax=candidate division WWE3 bacterium TaxID=2053526 RepID=A0A3A4ZFC5_UNCKA|nr:MAG: sodium:proton exchanger [candidate division WWE3 bacterium]
MEQFGEISLILLVALLVSTLMRLLKQPLVIGYILAGLLVGPYFFNILKSVEVVELFSKLGITALLFIVGLGLSPKILKELGPVSTVTGLGQVFFTSLFGYVIGVLLGFTPIESLYIAVALTFSSTIIILKLLSDKGDTHKLYGKIAVGFLLVQDLVATLILVIISSLNAVEGANLSVVLFNLFILLLKGFAMLALLFLISSKILSKLTGFIGRSQEFLFIGALAWGMGIAALYHQMGLSIEIGALVAGVSLSITPFSYEISSRLKPLRDFFITLFFILLGYQMVFDNWQGLISPTIIFSVFILIGNPLIVLLLMNFLGYSKKTGFLAGLTVAQISEFSLILVKLGFDVGHVSREVLSMVTLVGIITIAGSTYLILYSEFIYKKINKILSIFEIRKTNMNKDKHEKDFEAVIFGYRRAGPEFAHAFRESKTKFLVVEYNPDTIQHLANIKIPYEYGDASDAEFLQDLPLNNLKIAVSTIPDFETNMLLAQVIRRANQDTILIVIADTLEHATELYDAGVTNVVLSHYIGAQQAAEMILKHGLDAKKYQRLRNKHIKYLESIRELSVTH